MAAPQDQTGGGHHAVGALLARKLRIFFDAIDRHFRRTAEHREHRAVFQEIDRVIAPFAGRDHAAIEPEDPVELAPVEGHPADGGRRDRGAPQNLAWIALAEDHAAPPCCRLAFMIAPEANDSKGLRAASDRVAGITDSLAKSYCCPISVRPSPCWAVRYRQLPQARSRE